MTSEKNALLDIKDLSFTYRRTHKHALNSITLNIEKGEFIAILGRSGAGKSTFILTLNGLIPHFIKGDFEGSVLIDGVSTSGRSVAEISGEVGIIFQDFESQLFSTSVELEIAFGLENTGVEYEEIKTRIDKYLNLAGLSGFNLKEPALLSGGQKQRLAIAAVLAMEPLLVCLDEPTTDLDPEGKSSVFKLLDTIRKDRNRAIVAVEHETDELMGADRCIVIDSGKIVIDGPPEEIFRDISKIETLGIMPPQLAVLAQTLGAGNPFKNADDAYVYFTSNGFHLDTLRIQQIINEDKRFESSNGEQILNMEGVTFFYENEKSPVLDNIDLSICRGEIIAIAGKNGSGKTTLVKQINGLLKSTSGKIAIDGKDISTYSHLDLVQKAGFVFQNPDYQIFSETVEDEVAFTPKLLSLSEDEIRKRVSDSLQAVGLEENRKDDPFVLTKGQRQRIAVASVLAAKSDIIILDEPTTGLDYIELTGMMNLLLKLNSEGHTIIMVTHSMHVITKYARRLIIMQDGKIAFDGKTRDGMKNEKLLKECHIKLPEVVKLSSMLGHTLLNIDEFKSAIIKR